MGNMTTSRDFANLWDSYHTQNRRAICMLCIYSCDRSVRGKILGIGIGIFCSSTQSVERSLYIRCRRLLLNFLAIMCRSNLSLTTHRSASHGLYLHTPHRRVEWCPIGDQAPEWTPLRPRRTGSYANPLRYSFSVINCEKFSVTWEAFLHHRQYDKSLVLTVWFCVLLYTLSFYSPYKGFINRLCAKGTRLDTNKSMTSVCFSIHSMNSNVIQEILAKLVLSGRRVRRRGFIRKVVVKLKLY